MTSGKRLILSVSAMLMPTFALVFGWVTLFFGFLPYTAWGVIQSRSAELGMVWIYGIAPVFFWACSALVSVHMTRYFSLEAFKNVQISSVFFLIACFFGGAFAILLLNGEGKESKIFAPFVLIFGIMPLAISLKKIASAIFNKNPNGSPNPIP